MVFVNELTCTLTKTGLRLRSGRTSIKMVDWDYDKKEKEDNYDGPGSERGQVSAQGSMPKIPHPKHSLPAGCLGAALQPRQPKPHLNERVSRGRTVVPPESANTLFK